VSSSKDHAIVVGGGIAGLLVARVLAEHFKRVSLIERDRYPQDPTFRPGVSQGRQLHTVNLRGQHVLEELFPGILTKLVDHGAVVHDCQQDMIMHFPSGWAYRASSSYEYYFFSRHLMEWQVRQELRKYACVHVIEKQEVIGLLASDDKQSVTGVSMRARNGAAPAESALTDLTADLVVDTSGRESRSPQWLEALGYARPEETTVNPFLGVAARVYRPAADPNRDWKAMLIRPEPPEKQRGGMIMPSEGGYWWVSIGGFCKEYPPTDEEGFLEFAKTLPVPTLYEAIRDAQPASPIYSYRRTENRLRHFEKLQALPDGFVVAGDSFCQVNPIYGQGMALAAMAATTLRQSLAGGDLHGLPSRYYKELAKTVLPSWQATLSNDYRVPGVEGGEINETTRIMQRYFDDITNLLPNSPSIRLTFLEVTQMLKPTTALLHPSVILQVAEDSGNIEIAQAVLRIARQEYPHLDMEQYQAKLDGLVQLHEMRSS
jgi:flavin-dependent dehydrogenase